MIMKYGKFMIPICSFIFNRMNMHCIIFFKHFADILKLNDEVYKTKYMYVDLGHGAKNMDIKSKIIFSWYNCNFIKFFKLAFII